jgi:hypothetical protein
MAKPTHPVLVEQFGRELSSLVNESTEVWQVTMQLLVPKGVNVEQKMADVATGKWQNNEPIMMSYTDVSKIK